MPVLLQYIIKLSISLAAVFLFYRLFLRKLTFYQWNRWYLLGYSLLCFFLPMMNIYWWMEADSRPADFVRQLPKLEVGKAIPNENSGPIELATLVMVVIVGGALVMLFKLLFQYISFLRLHRKAVLIASEEVAIYEVKHSIIPFSFGNAVYLNPSMHETAELKEIIRHELVHVRQKHSVDILFTEFMVALTWFNPFSWLIRQAIRQNLEFIADKAVLAHGVDRKTYQYLLLKVIGQKQFSLASHLNFTALKNRINMMNSFQSARIHLVKFSFALPVVAILLLAFRKENLTDNQQEVPIPTPAKVNRPTRPALQISAQPMVSAMAADTLPEKEIQYPGPNSKGYIVTVADNMGECIVIIKDKQQKLLKAVLLTDWNKDEAAYINKYGKIIPPPPPPAPPLPPAPASAPAAGVAASPVQLAAGAPTPLPVIQPGAPALAIEPIAPLAPHTPRAPKVPKLKIDVHSIHINNGRAKVVTKEGKTEIYDLNNAVDKAGFEKKYGSIAEPPEPPEPVAIEETDVVTIEGEPVTLTIGEGDNKTMLVTDKITMTTRQSTDSLDQRSIQTLQLRPMTAKPIVFIDGKEKTVEEMNALNPNLIESVSVVKDGHAIREFGERGRNGVVKVQLKKK